MKSYDLRNRASRVLIGLMLAAAFIITGNIGDNLALALNPQVPVLSLTGSGGGYDKKWYPDGRIWLPASVDKQNYREILIPVFIDNKWYTYPESKNLFYADPIYSFQFSILYDSTSLRAIGVQAFGPRDEVLGYKPLANSFNMTWYDNRDTNYRKYLKPDAQFQDKQKGRRITIVGTSTSKPLPNTSLSSGSDFQILMYVKFQVVANYPDGLGEAQNTPLYIAPDVIKYNDCNIRITNAFAKYGLGTLMKADQDLSAYSPQNLIYGQGGSVTGLEGIENTTSGLNPVEPTYPGTIYLKYCNLPKFEFTLIRGLDTIPIRKVNTDEKFEIYEIVQPVTIDSGSINPQWGSRLIQIKNSVSGSRMSDIYLESDQPWLLFKNRRLGPTDKVDIPTRTRRGFISYIDEGILGDYKDPMNKETVKDGQIFLEIQCDPSQLELVNQGEKAGVYIGYITFRSSTADKSPIKLKVTFIYFRNPREGAKPGSGRKWGVDVSIRNSASPVQTTNMIFGTGYRATNGIDSLFGEYPYLDAMNSFGARWYWHPSMDTAGVDLSEVQLLTDYGLGDWAPDDDNTDGTPKHSFSRNIRSVNDTLRSIIYYCKFNAGGESNYPIVITWDTTDFLPDSRLFLKDDVNGSKFNVDMRAATPYGPNKFTYTIEDATLDHFVIEYTLPSVMRIVDSYGAPIIKNGWNLLSIPRLPVNTNYKAIYRHAINEPIKFANVYQQAEKLEPGIGYFVRYPDNMIDTTFAGGYIVSVKQTNNPVLLYTGWNTIGALSFPMPTKNIELQSYNQADPPDINETFKKSIYGYRTNEGYKPVSEIIPGLGYWMYVNKGAYLKMLAYPGAKIFNSVEDDNPKNLVFRNATRIDIRDNAQNHSSLYLSSNKNMETGDFELPPLPPYGLYDTRFANNAFVENNDNSVIMLQGAAHPVQLSMNNADANYTFVDAVSGEQFGTILKGSSNTIVIKNANSNAVKVLKANVTVTENALSVYPNPVEKNSTIQFSVSENSLVTIKLFDALGNEVRTIINENRNQGDYNDATIDASGLVSGAYILKMTSGSHTLIKKVEVVK